MSVRLVAYDTTGGFGSIRPDEKDIFTFDFTVPANGLLLLSSSAIVASLAPGSPQLDPSAASRVLAAATVSGGQLSALIGTAVDGAVYLLTGTANFASGRSLVASASFECTLVPLPASLNITPAKFRQDFPAFRSPRDYPDEMIAFWITVVLNQTVLDPNRWVENLVLGQELFVAHMLTLERQNQLVTRRGRAAMAVGPAASRSVGGVSVSYDLSGAYSNDAGFWNLSSYGQRFWYYANQAGMGPIQVI